MGQIHRRFTAEQVKVLFKGYREGTIDRASVEETLGIGKTRFFALLKEYRWNPKTFSLSYKRATPVRLSRSVETEIAKELLREKELVDDKRLPISGYNYSALRDRLSKKGITVSLSTIIRRAKSMDCYIPHRKGKVHDRQVLTAAIGALVQHDASLHLWSPYASEKWTLITSIDDFSRKLLFADFFPHETTWSHIQAAQTLMQTHGIPLRYYVDSLRVFRFIQSRDSVWRKHVLQTDEADPQWRQMMRVLGVDVTYALSPQAKGKVERPYRWLQDRIVRTCALEKLSTIDEARQVLREEVSRYNHHQVHSTTGEIPAILFDEASIQGNSLFRPFILPKPYTSAKDIFCLREKRMVNAYRRIALFNQELEVPNVPLREEVEIHMIPDPPKDLLELRVWWEDHMVYSATLPLNIVRGVHF